MDNQAEERGNGVPQDVGRLINTISHQLKRQMCAEEENDSLTNMQRHILHYILFQSLKKRNLSKRRGTGISDPQIDSYGHTSAP